MDLQSQADAFRAQKPHDDVDPSWNLLTGVALPKALKTEHAHPQGPIFTHMNDNNFPNLYSDDKIVIYLNNALPYLEAYPNAEHRAAMSFMHLLVVPKERIYNVATMRGAADADLLSYMRGVVDMAYGQAQWRKRLAEALEKQNFLDAPDAVLTPVNRETYHEAMRRYEAGRPRDLEYYFHAHPHHSVGHLHMHVLLGTTLTESYNLNSYKNMPFSAAYNEVAAKKCDVPA